MPDTLVGVDALIRSELERFASHWFWTLLAFTLLVALGLACELPEIWHDTLEALREICRHPTVRRKLSPWAKLAGTFGWVLIIAGVVGEGIAEGFLFKADGLVLKFDEILLQDTNSKSNGAVADAVALTKQFGGLHEFVVAKEGELATQFGALKQYADVENKRTETVIAKLNDDRQRLDKARTDAVAAADEAKDALAAVNAARKPRTLTLDQQRTIANKMAVWSKIPNSASMQRVAVFPTTGIFESAHLADIIAAVLGPGQAGWDVNRFPVTFDNGMPLLSGVGIFTSSDARGEAVAAALAEALNKEGILTFVAPEKWKICEGGQMSKHPDTDPICSHVTVVVGDHP
jgi:hypothetical protein